MNSSVHPYHRKMYVSLSKLLTLILRHEPERVGIKLRPDGFVNLDELVACIRKIRRFAWVKMEDILFIAKNDTKGRFELQSMEDRILIRARYGHNKRLGIRIEYPEVKLGEVKLLYHGTKRAFLGSIMKEGLRPMNRMYAVSYTHLTLPTTERV